ncbi:MAG: hypothetical protein KDA38_02935 [Planctomycetales bacterium]|nr:hypothetical protein [Planctomycetales bacterium]
MSSVDERRRWFDPRFGLRTLLVMVTVAGIAVAWWTDRRALESRLIELESELAVIRKAAAPSWGVEQLLGPPDVSAPGDNGAAWASATQDGQAEWLEVTFDKRVKPTVLAIHETHCPGAVVKVTAFDRAGRETVAWQGADPTPATSLAGVSLIPMKINFATNRVKIYLDSPAVPGWNEIDAVELRDSAGGKQWATAAEASSTYGSSINSNRPQQFRFVY